MNFILISITFIKLFLHSRHLWSLSYNKHLLCSLQEPHEACTIMTPFAGELGETWDTSPEPLSPEPVSVPLRHPTSLLSPASPSSLTSRGKGLRA